jgi:hypothetical protein
MTAIPTADASFDIGRVISRLFAVLGRNFVTFLLLAILLAGLPTGAASLLQLLRMSPMFGENGVVAPSAAAQLFEPTSIALSLLAGLVAAMGNAVLQGSVIHGAVSDLAGRKASFGDCLGTGLRFFLPLIAIGIISSVCVFFGCLVFLVPGILLALAWSVATPAEVVERTGVFGAFNRSLELTRNHRGAIFGLAIIAAVVGIIFSMASGAIAAALFLMVGRPGAGAMFGVMAVQTFASLLAQTASSLIGSVGVASTYYELRQIKEGVGAEQLAAVFD